jgi:hypothetical protein
MIAAIELRIRVRVCVLFFVPNLSICARESKRQNIIAYVKNDVDTAYVSPIKSYKTSERAE